MVDESPSTETRRFPRVKETCKLRYKRVETGSLPAEGAEALSVNISGGGICFQVGEAVASGTLLAVELMLPNFDASVVALGRTVWCRPDEGDRHEVGLEFWWIGWGDDGAQKAIADHIRQALDD
jgi:PilZ domain